MKSPALKKTPSSEAAAQTRERLLEAAAEVFNRDGYHGTDSNRIARAAGFAPGTFYKHFTDKREVFLLVYSRWVESEWQDIQAIWRSPDANETTSATATKIRELVNLVVAHHQRWAGVRRSLRALCDTDEEVRSFRNQRRSEQLDALRTLRGGRDSATRRADDLYILLVFERICDAIADGEVAEMGASKRQLGLHLEALLAN